MSSHPINPQTNAVLRPAATIPKAAPADEGRGNDWQREMERAQMELWLSHSVVGYRALTLTGSPVAPQAGAAPVSIAAPSAVAVSDAGRTARQRDAKHGAVKHDPAPAHGRVDHAHGTQMKLASIDEAHPHVEEESAGGLQFIANERVSASALVAAPSSVAAPDSSLPMQGSTAAPSYLRTPMNHGEPTAAPLAAATERMSAGMNAGIDASLRAALLGTQKMADEIRSFGPVHPSTGHASIDDSSDEMWLGAPSETATVEVAAVAAPLIRAASWTNAAISAIESPTPFTTTRLVATQTAIAQIEQSSPSVPTQLSLPLPTTSQSANAIEATHGEPFVRARATASIRSSNATLPNSEPTPIRLHADWSEEGIRLWLGMHNDLLPHLAAITAQLQRWIGAQGLKMLSLSCNGREIDAPPHEPTQAQADLLAPDKPEIGASPGAPSAPKFFLYSNVFHTCS